MSSSQIIMLGNYIKIDADSFNFWQFLEEIENEKTAFNIESKYRTAGNDRHNILLLNIIEESEYEGEEWDSFYMDSFDFPITEIKGWAEKHWKLLEENLMLKNIPFRRCFGLVVYYM